MSILLTDGGYKHTLAAAKSLAMAGFEVDVIGRKYCLCKFSKYVNNVVVRDDTYFNNPKAFIEKNCLRGYEAIIPIGAKSVKLFSEKYNYLLPRNTLKINKNSLAIALSKSETKNLADLLAIPTPMTWESEDLINKSSNYMLDFPLVIKSNNEILKVEPVYVHSELELKREIFRFLARYEIYPIVQQKISGHGLGFTAFALDGKVSISSAHVRLREAPASGGVSSASISIDPPFEIVEYSKRIIEKLMWTGPIMIEYKFNLSDQEYKLIEINPKYWGSLQLSIMSGVDVPLFHANYLINKTLLQKNDITHHKFMWIEEELIHLFSNVKSLPILFKDWFIGESSTNFDIADILPSMYMLIRGFYFGLKNSIRNSMPYKFFARIKRTGLKYSSIRYFSETFGIPFLKYSKVSDTIFVGSRLSNLGYYYLKFSGITAVIDLRAEFVGCESQKLLNTMRIPVIEFSTPTLSQLEDAFNFYKTTERLYIHCSEGVGRAPLFAAYIHHRDTGLKFEDSLKHISLVRPFVSLTSIQKKFISRFEKADV